MLILEMVLFVFWVVVGAVMYGYSAWAKKRLAQRAKAADTELGKKERKNLERIVELRPRALFGCVMMAAAMLLIVLSHTK